MVVIRTLFRRRGLLWRRQGVRASVVVRSMNVQGDLLQSRPSPQTDILSFCDTKTHHARRQNRP